MKKAEACELLKISDRSLARYAAQGKIAVTYHKGKRGNVAEYNDDDVKRLKDELAAPVGARKPAVERVSNPDNTSLQTMSDFGDALQAALMRIASDARTPPAQVEIAFKLLLTLKEASALSNLSTDYLKQAIKAGKLKAAIIGRGWKVKRAELERFISKL